MSEFSRRVDVEIIKDEPKTREDYVADRWKGNAIGGVNVDDEYAAYLDRFQPYRWRAVAANNEPVAHGESYFNEAGCLNAIELNYGDDTTVYRVPMYGEDRGETLLRYGATDRASQQP